MHCPTTVQNPPRCLAVYLQNRGRGFFSTSCPSSSINRDLLVPQRKSAALSSSGPLHTHYTVDTGRIAGDRIRKATTLSAAIRQGNGPGVFARVSERLEMFSPGKHTTPFHTCRISGPGKICMMSHQQSSGKMGCQPPTVATHKRSLALARSPPRVFLLPPVMRSRRQTAALSPTGETDVWDHTAGKHVDVTNEWQPLTGVASRQCRTHGT